MKRIIVFLLIVFILIIGFYYTKNENNNNLNFDKITFISTKYYPQLKEYSCKNGNQYYYSFNKSQSQVYQNIELNNIDGIVYYLNPSFDVNKYLKNLDFYYQGGNLDNGYKIFYGYDGNIKDNIFIDGKKINTQVVVRNNDILIGNPIILTGY